MRVDEIMSRKVVSVPSDTLVAEALDLMVARRIHHLLVIDGGRLSGLVAIRELSGKSHDLPVSAIMSRGIRTAGPHSTLREAAVMMAGTNGGCLPIVENGKVIGIVTNTDLMRVLARKEAAARAAHETV